MTNARAVSEIRAAAERLDASSPASATSPHDIAVRQRPTARDPDPALVPYLVSCSARPPSVRSRCLHRLREQGLEAPDACLAMHRKGYPGLTPVEYDTTTPNRSGTTPQAFPCLLRHRALLRRGAGNISMVSLTVPVWTPGELHRGGRRGPGVGSHPRAGGFDPPQSPDEVKPRDLGDEYAFLVSPCRQGRRPSRRAAHAREGFAGADLADLPGGPAFKPAPRDSPRSASRVRTAAFTGRHRR